ncbi:MAG: S-layer homology domain-containing protein [Bacillota bacterium]|nr:S-layer homology domain-containing protein [Bacillota bacterium]MDW7685205.1 S-layer homology domain-containing protein [Bacillota bacterium]
MKSNKLLSVILVLAMMFTMVAFAGAASFPDVSGDTDAAVTRLAGLGILAGYPDGTFKPDNSITRAEFAKVAVLTMGLETTADLLMNVNSKFADVEAGKWYTGYVNVATNLNVLKGYPDGTFKPDAYISEAEAITIILRLLGYNDELSGDWPFDYIVQGNQLGIIGSGFNASGNAKRGSVAVWVSKAIDETLVTYDKDADTFKDVADTAKDTLLEKAFAGKYVEDHQVVSVIRGADDADYHTLDGADVSKNVKVANGTFGAGLVNHIVNYTTKTIDSDEVIVSIAVTSTSVTGKTSKLDTTNKKITIGSTTYTYTTTSAPADGTENVTAYVNSKGKIYKFVVGAIKSGEILGKSTTSTTTDGTTTVENKLTVSGTVYEILASDASITRNGAAATFADLQVGDEVDYKVTDGKFSMINAWYVTVEGVVNSWTKSSTGDFKTITIDNTTYNVAEDNTLTTVTVGVKAEFTLNADNEIKGLVDGSVQEATAVVGTLAGTSIASSADGPVYFVTLTNGVSYDISDALKFDTVGDEVYGALYVNKAQSLFTVDLADLADETAIKISYNTSGKVTKVEMFEPNAVFTTIPAGLEQDSTTYSSNGKAVTEKSTDDFYRVTWDGVTGKASHISGITFNVTEAKVTAKTTETVDGKTKYMITAGETTYEIKSGAVILKDGATSNFTAIDINDLASFAAEGNVITYMEVTTPE